MTRVGVYIRVSTQRQAQSQTIEQQLQRLKSHLELKGWPLAEQHIFRDDGQSGTTLNRPGLQRLRDQVRLGALDRVILTAPDRLARKYVHQVLLVEEMEQLGCHIEFLDRPLSDSPDDQLMLQIRGAVAEYERSLIVDRMRRGRLMKYEAGLLLPWTAVPYGYRTDPAHPRDPRGVRIEAVEAAVVAEIFTLYLQPQSSLGAVVRYLHDHSIPSPRGGPRWCITSVRRILRNPVYTGRVYANREHPRATYKRRSPLQPVGKSKVSYHPNPPEEWIEVIGVPAIISQAQFDLVKAKMAQNQRFASRNNQAHCYLLRALLSCGVCRLALRARTMSGYAYYKCENRRVRLTCPERRCYSRGVSAERLDELVWQDVCQVLTNPKVIEAALARAQAGDYLPDQVKQRRERLQQAATKLEHQLERLTEAYLSEVIKLEEYKRRRAELELKKEAIGSQVKELEAQVNRQLEISGMMKSIGSFCDRIVRGLTNASFEQKRLLVELLIDRVVVSNEQVEIRYVIPTSQGSEKTHFCQLRSDYLGLIHPPTCSYRIPMRTGLHFQLRGILEHPAVECGVVDRDAALRHHFLQLTVAQRVGHVGSARTKG